MRGERQANSSSASGLRPTNAQTEVSQAKLKTTAQPVLGSDTSAVKAEPVEAVKAEPASSLKAEGGPAEALTTDTASGVKAESRTESGEIGQLQGDPGQGEAQPAGAGNRAAGISSGAPALAVKVKPEAEDGVPGSPAAHLEYVAR